MSEKEESKAADRRFLFARPNERSTIRKFRERSTGEKSGRLKRLERLKRDKNEHVGRCETH